MTLSRVNGNLTIQQKKGPDGLWVKRIFGEGRGNLDYESRDFLFLYNFVWCIIINHLTELSSAA